MKLSSVVKDYISDNLSVNQIGDTHSVSLRGMSIAIPPVTFEYQGALRVPMHLSTVIDEISWWYHQGTKVDMILKNQMDMHIYRKCVHLI